MLSQLKNKLRNQLKKSILGKILLNTQPKESLNTLCVVSATRLSERDFWRKSALGQSLQPALANPEITAKIYYKNTDGLPKAYNPHLKNKDASDIIVFIHDDVWIDDEAWVEKLKIALKTFDIVGVAGNTKRSKNQSAWCRIKQSEGVKKESSYVWDDGNLSGGIAHGHHRRGTVQMLGPTPAPCLLLDGVMLAVSKKRMQENTILFDEQFDFNFYDMDFCRTVQKAGLSMGTWPIALTHQSGGLFSGEKWKAGEKLYFGKWGS